MHEDKRARPDHAIQDFLAERWSPYGFDPRPLPAADLRLSLIHI